MLIAKFEDRASWTFVTRDNLKIFRVVYATIFAHSISVKVLNPGLSFKDSNYIRVYLIRFDDNIKILVLKRVSEIERLVIMILSSYVRARNSEPLFCLINLIIRSHQLFH